MDVGRKRVRQGASEVHSWLVNDVEQGYIVLRQGGIILAPADIGYGLFCHSEDSVRRMYKLKGRPANNPCIIIGNLQVLHDLVEPLPPEMWDFLRSISRQTTIAVIGKMARDSILLTSLPEFTRRQSTKEGTVAVFLNTGVFLETLVERAARDNVLIVGSSANLSSQGNNYRFENVPEQIVKGVDWCLDYGACKYHNPDKLATTILNLNDFSYQRKGVNFELIDSSVHALKQVLGYG